MRWKQLVPLAITLLGFAAQCCFAQTPTTVLATAVPPTARADGSGSIGAREAYQDLLLALTTDVKELRFENEQLRRRAEQVEEHLTMHEERSAQIFKRILEKIAENDASRCAEPDCTTAAGARLEEKAPPIPSQPPPPDATAGTGQN